MGKESVAGMNLADQIMKYQDLAEQAFVGVYVIQDGKFVYVNPRMAEIFGYSVDELVGKLGSKDVIYPEDFPHIHEKSIKRLVGEIERDYYQFRGVRKDREIIFVEIYGSRIPYQNRPAVYGVLNDITLKKKAEEELVQELQHKRDFISIASHELLTPLQPILGYLDVILNDPDRYDLSSESRRLLGLMNECALREERIVNRMLEYSMLNIEPERIQPVIKKFSPATIIGVILDSNKYRSEASIDMTIPEGLIIESDADFFYRIFHELCSNALQYSSAPREVGISYAHEGDSHRFSVVDNGSGMSAETLRSVFRPFFISDGKHLSRKYGRIGIGLPLAKQYTELLGGKISVSSESGKGSTLTVRLPESPAARTAASPSRG